MTGTSFSTDIAPDVVLKLAADPGFGHYEVPGLGRAFRSAITSNTQTTVGGGIGAGAYVPLVPDMLTFQPERPRGQGHRPLRLGITE